MNRSQFSLNFWILFAASLFFNGCGYHLVGTGSSLPTELKTLSISVFSNSSSEPEIHRELTSNIIDSFITDGRLKVVGKGSADMVMKGTLYYYDLKAVSFSSNDFVSDYIVELGVDVQVIDKVNDKLYMKDKFKTKWDYRATSDIVNTESARLAALEEAYKELGNRLVSLLIDQF
ncbi:MAG: hypothetical protein HOF21_09105 [Nitrospina sp.]|jgi:hypothetical protein|nr:hypothetical protein [Nitrospina sp.]MBT5632222.1 hypothetical protein [Nitrospina sp.]